MFKMPEKSSKKAAAQVDKFRDLARELETDESQEQFDERLRKIAKSSPQKGDDKGKKD